MKKRKNTQSDEIKLCAFCNVEPVAKDRCMQGNYLCVKCARKSGYPIKGELPNRCQICGCESQDPATPGVRLTYKWQEKPEGYYCDWCLLTKKKNDFISNRIGDWGRDRRTLIAKVGLVPKEGINLNENQHWHYEKVFGTELKEELKDYLFWNTGFVWMKKDKPFTDVNNWPQNIRHSYYWFDVHPKDPYKLLWICRQTIFYKYSLGYLEIVWDKSSPSLEIKNIQNMNSLKELGAFWKMSRTSERIITSPGKRPSYVDAESFERDFIRACHHLYNEFDTTDFKAREISDSMLISRRSLYEFAEKFELNVAEMKEKAIKAIRDEILNNNLNN